jgi:hypothetical protein
MCHLTFPWLALGLCLPLLGCVLLFLTLLLDRSGLPFSRMLVSLALGFCLPLHGLQFKGFKGFKGIQRLRGGVSLLATSSMRSRGWDSEEMVTTRLGNF